MQLDYTGRPNAIEYIHLLKRPVVPLLKRPYVVNAFAAFKTAPQLDPGQERTHAYRNIKGIDYVLRKNGI